MPKFKMHCSIGFQFLVMLMLLCLKKLWNWSMGNLRLRHWAMSLLRQHTKLDKLEWLAYQVAHCHIRWKHFDHICSRVCQSYSKWQQSLREGVWCIREIASQAGLEQNCTNLNVELQSGIDKTGDSNVCLSANAVKTVVLGNSNQSFGFPTERSATLSWLDQECKLEYTWWGSQEKHSFSGQISPWRSWYSRKQWTTQTLRRQNV